MKVNHSIPNLVGGAAAIEASWDFLHRTGMAGMTVYAGKDKDYKFALDVHSKKVSDGFMRFIACTVTLISKSMKQKYCS